MGAAWCRAGLRAPACCCVWLRAPRGAAWSSEAADTCLASFQTLWSSLLLLAFFLSGAKLLASNIGVSGSKRVHQGLAQLLGGQFVNQNQDFFACKIANENTVVFLTTKLLSEM